MLAHTFKIKLILYVCRLLSYSMQGAMYEYIADEK